MRIISSIAGARGDHAAVGRADERFAGEGDAVFRADAIAERDEVAVLKCGDLHLGFVQAVGPLADRPGLRHDDQVGAASASARMYSG